jgi:hypothetical protein
MLSGIVSVTGAVVPLHAGGASSGFPSRAESDKVVVAKVVPNAGLVAEGLKAIRPAEVKVPKGGFAIELDPAAAAGLFAVRTASEVDAILGRCRALKL